MLNAKWTFKQSGFSLNAKLYRETTFSVNENCNVWCVCKKRVMCIKGVRYDGIYWPCRKKQKVFDTTMTLVQSVNSSVYWESALQNFQFAFYFQPVSIAISHPTADICRYVQRKHGRIDYGVDVCTTKFWYLLPILFRKKWYAIPSYVVWHKQKCKSFSVWVKKF